MENHHSAEFSLANELQGAEAAPLSRNSPPFMKFEGHCRFLKAQQLGRVLICVAVCNIMVSLKLGVVSH